MLTRANSKFSWQQHSAFSGRHFNGGWGHPSLMLLEAMPQFGRLSAGLDRVVC